MNLHDHAEIITHFNTMIWITSIAICAGVILSLKTLRRKIIINRWYKTLSLKKHHSIYRELFAEIDGFSLSREARQEHDAIEYTYGEIDFISFIALLSLTKPSANTVFYDLGSGTGKAVIACAMVFNVSKSCGIERLSPLHLTAVQQQQKLHRQTDYPSKANATHFFNADFLSMDIHDATLVFVNSTAFFGETWLAINQHLKQLSPGTLIITTSKKLSDEGFVVKQVTTVQMSWGLVKAYIHEVI